jgi:hypothetical protein
MKNSTKFIWISQSAVAAVVFLSRLGVLPSNYSPLGTFGFFSGNAILYFGIIIGFDYFVGGFYEGFLFTYAGFLAYFLLGRVAKNTIGRQLLFVPVASVSFFLISNIGSWWYWYPHNFEGLLSCYALALPFFQNTFIADIGFGYSFILCRCIHWKKASHIIHLHIKSLSIK